MATEYRKLRLDVRSPSDSEAFDKARDEGWSLEEHDLSGLRYMSHRLFVEDPSWRTTVTEQELVDNVENIMRGDPVYVVTMRRER